MLNIRTLSCVFAISLIFAFVAFFVPEASTESMRPETVYSNTEPITINTNAGLTAPTRASLYPSPITVSGMTGTTTKVEVTLKGFSHVPHQMDFLLVSPTGAEYIFLSDPQAGIIDDRIYTFSDTGSVTLNTSVASGTYLPTDSNTGADTFPAPAPAAPYDLPPVATFASVFNGSNPNGTWNLYAVDDQLFGTGRVSSGWSLSITTDGTPQTFLNLAELAFNDITLPASPYGNSINVAGAGGVISNLKVTLTGFSHANPNDADIMLVSPNGKGLVIMSDVPASVAGSVNLTFDDAAPSIISNSPLVSGTYKPTDFFSDTDFFPAPAPLPPIHANNASLSNFNGFSPNGEWRLFVVDDNQASAGSISGGWSLDITTTPIVPPVPASCSGPSFSPTSYPTGTNPTNIAIADLNNDGNADLAVTNQVSNDVSILIGNGNGTFSAQALVTAGSGPYSIVAGRFNADNNFDLAVANSVSNNVSILLGNGNGTFSAATNFFVGPSPISISAGDLNNDTFQDLVVANFGGFFSGSVSILLGNGTGSFAAGANLRVRTQPSFVSVVSFNGDGNRDLIVANFGADSVTTFLGLGNGTFALNQNIVTGTGPVSFEYADLGTDGIGDLAIANYNADTITYCTGSSNGLFVSCNLNNPAGGANPISITAADFVGSGTKTTATALSGSNVVKIGVSSVSVGQNPNAIESTDFNGDGRPDMVTVNAGSNDVSVLINSCSAAKGNLFDFNGDRLTDYAVFRPATSAWFNYSLNQTGAASIFGRPTDILAPADFDGDRRTDYAIYRPESGLWLVLDMASRPIYYVQFGIPEDIPAPGDFDGDGKADIAVFRPSDANWYIRRSTDNVMQITRFGSSGDKPVAADYDGDGKADIAVYRPSTGIWYILRSSDGQVTITRFGLEEDKTVPADYDGDGKADIALWRPSTGAWYLLRSSDGSFLATTWGLSGDIPVVGDFDGDGKFDIAVWRPSDNTWYVRKSSDGGVSYFQWGLSTDKPIPSAYVR